MLTNQEAFNKAVSGVLIQGNRSFNADGRRLRGPDGTKCAIGHLLTDGVYHVDMESYSLKQLGVIMGADSEILARLLSDHDTVHCQEQYRARSRITANLFELETEVLL